MMVVVLVAGIGLLLAGLVTVGFGIQLDLSFGNTLILAGAVTACTGIVMLGLWTVVRELRNIASRLGDGVATESRIAAALHPAAGAGLGDPAQEDGGFLFGRDQPAPQYADAPPADQSAAPPPWHEEAASRDRGRGEVSPPVPKSAETAAAPKARRNLLFSSTSRKERERERAQARTTELPGPDPRPGPSVAPPPFEPGETPPATFDDAWPKIERARAADGPPRRTGRTPVTSSEPGAGAPATDRYPPAARSEEQPPVTILKSGVVDGMAYSLYSDGSIEAQMPEGMMRFASIDELRAHLDQRT
jgi:hypothetical protein